LSKNNPDTPELHRLLATSYQNLGNVYFQGGQLDKAEAQYQEALTVLEKLVTRYGGVLQYQIDMGGVTGNLGEVFAQRGNHEAALKWQERTIDILKAVLRKQGDNVEARQFLVNARRGRAVSLDQLNRSAEAVAEWDRALVLANGPDRIPLRCARAISLARSGEHAKAVAEADQMARERNPAASVLYDLACVYSQSFAAAERDAKLPPLEKSKLAEQYARHAVELLAKANAAEFFRTAANLENLKKDRDLDPLRSRADFQELEEKAKTGR
jgi:tetratricopeptide (TPR) repeat protein